MNRRTLPVLIALLALAAALPASAASFTRKPFLQNPTTSSATVSFVTDSSCAARVVAAAQDGQEKSASDGGGTRHALRLEGLAAGAAYAWRVEACGAVATGTLETAPPLGTQSVHFVAVGDSGTASSTQVAAGDQMRRLNPEIFLHLGDSAYDNGTESELQSRHFTPWAALLAQVPSYLVLGNHEYNTDQARPTLDALELPGNERYYSFDRGHVHFVALDSNCIRGYGATSSSCVQADMLAWLEADLAANQQPWTVATFHHPPWSSGDHASQTVVREAFGPVLERHGVDLVLNGHDHIYERTHPMVGNRVAGSGEKGIPYVVVGTGGASLKPFSMAQPAWSAARRNDAYGFLDVQVDGGTLAARFISSTGQVLDTLTLKKDVPVTEPKPDPQPTPDGGVTPDPQPTPDGGVTPEPQPTPDGGVTPAPGGPATPDPTDGTESPTQPAGGGCASSAMGAFGAALAGLFGRRRLRRR